MRNKDSYFSHDYATARARFRAMSVAAGAKMFTLTLERLTPEQTPLTIDIAWLGSAKPQAVILNTSGIHGVEGFAGSAIQLKLLSRLPDVGKNHALILVHILNPYGMAWLRRVNELNVDLNRNFICAPQTWTGSARPYRQLDQVLNPVTLSPFENFYLKALYCLSQYGYQTLKTAVAAGQYDFPQGLFYGGAFLQQGPQLYQQWLSQQLATVPRILAVDIHTGLGLSGHEYLITHQQATTDLAQKLERRLRPSGQQKFGYPIHGAMLDLLPVLFPDARIDAITQEFGTYPEVRVLKALRAENYWSRFEIPFDHPSRLWLKRMFHPPSEKWENTILNFGTTLIHQAARMLNFAG